MVEHSNAYPEINGSNAATARMRDQLWMRKSFIELASQGSTMIEHSNPYPDINGSEAATT